jgi:hypothetical protein
MANHIHIDSSNYSVIFLYNYTHPTTMIGKILLLLLMMNGCTISAQQKELCQHWIHSHEEDNTEKGYRTYRPSSYNFPPSRGRDGFEIKKDGTAIDHPIAPTDGNLTVQKKWKVEKDQLIIEDEKEASRFQIISISQDKLVVKPIHNR